MAKIKIKHSQTIAEVFSNYLLSKRAQGIAEKTAETYAQHFSAISKHLDTNKNILELSSIDLDQMINSMRNKHLSANSIRSYTTTLKAFFSWCNAENIISLNIKKYKGEETIKEVYSDNELSILLKKPNMRNCSFAEYRSWVIINFLVNSGSRAATIRNIQVRDLDLQNGLIYARHTKNRKALVIPLCSELVVIMKEYLLTRGGQENDCQTYTLSLHASQTSSMHFCLSNIS